MQNRNATDKLNQQCSKVALLSYHKFQQTMLIYHIVDLACISILHFASDNQLAILCIVRLQNSYSFCECFMRYFETGSDGMKA